MEKRVGRDKGENMGEILSKRDRGGGAGREGEIGSKIKAYGASDGPRTLHRSQLK